MGLSLTDKLLEWAKQELVKLEETPLVRPTNVGLSLPFFVSIAKSRALYVVAVLHNSAQR